MIGDFQPRMEAAGACTPLEAPQKSRLRLHQKLHSFRDNHRKKLKRKARNRLIQAMNILAPGNGAIAVTAEDDARARSPLAMELRASPDNLGLCG
jgi:hypothetical protein